MEEYSIKSLSLQKNLGFINAGALLKQNLNFNSIDNLEQFVLKLQRILHYHGLYANYEIQGSLSCAWRKGLIDNNRVAQNKQKHVHPKHLGTTLIKWK